VRGEEVNDVLIERKARDAAGNSSPPSNSVSVLIEDQPPSAPPNLRVEHGKLVWHPATDNSGGRRLRRVLRRLIALWEHTGTTVPLQRFYDPMQDAYYPAAGTHTFTVKARDASGNISAVSNPVTATGWVLTTPGSAAQKAARRSKEDTIGVLQPRTSNLTTKNRKLVPEHHDLELLELTRAQTQRRHRKRTPKQQIHQRHKQEQTPSTRMRSEVRLYGSRRQP
jgi:hypothetical protein